MAKDTGDRRRGAAVLASLAFLGASGIASLALFTTEVEVQTLIETGSFRMAINGEEAGTHSLRLSSHVLNPGMSATAPVSLQNTGTVDSVVHLTAGGGGALAGALDATVRLADGTVLYSGPFHRLELDPIYLAGGTRGTPGQRVDLTVELSAPTSMGNDFQGLHEQVVLDVQAVQAEGV